MKINICNLHDEIIKRADEITKLDRRISIENPEDLLERLEIAIQLASDIYDYASDAKIAGRKMEDRLKNYRDAIESLGFIRNKD